MAKRRPSGDGMVRKREDGRWEGSCSLKLPNGKRESHNIYAKTREECEEKLAEMIVRVKAEIAEEKAKLKEGAY